MTESKETEAPTQAASPEQKQQGKQTQLFGWMGSTMSQALNAVGGALGDLVDDVEDTLDEVMGTKAETPKKPPTPTPTPTPTPKKDEKGETTPSPLKRLLQSSPVALFKTPDKPTVDEAAVLVSSWEAPDLTRPDGTFDTFYILMETEIAVDGEISLETLKQMGTLCAFDIVRSSTQEDAVSIFNKFIEKLIAIERLAVVTLSSPQHSPGEKVEKEEEDGEAPRSPKYDAVTPLTQHTDVLKRAMAELLDKQLQK
eukprot:TRINITY_DN28233_c0_g1_i1.p1 TRINITY_DN28233_c0_g1~~TRINITY_DN28233_c0_g1_i1.p1  ORF type:complete len:266 (+),score=69.62 TRINITY_DN28233_c0_g1_i1:36-800(+)